LGLSHRAIRVEQIVLHLVPGGSGGAYFRPLLRCLDTPMQSVVSAFAPDPEGRI